MIYFQPRYPIIYHVNYAGQSQARSKKFPAVKESFEFFMISLAIKNERVFSFVFVFCFSHGTKCSISTF